VPTLESPLSPATTVKLAQVVVPGGRGQQNEVKEDKDADGELKLPEPIVLYTSNFHTSVRSEAEERSLQVPIFTFPPHRAMDTIIIERYCQCK
jgi:hypothetical protein